MFKLVLLNAIKLGAAFVGGLILAAMIILMFGLVAQKVYGHEPTSVAVRPATLGEENRSLNYNVDTLEEVPEVVIQYEVATSSCADLNAYLDAQVDMIEAFIKDHPDNEGIFKNALDTIEELRCDD